MQKPSRRHTREGSATDATKPASHVLARVLVSPHRLEKGEASQELGGLMRPSPSHCGSEDHQPRATPCTAELRVGPLLSSPGFFQDLLTTERSSPPGSSVAVQWCAPENSGNPSATISKRRPSTLGSATSKSLTITLVEFFFCAHKIGTESQSPDKMHLLFQQIWQIRGAPVHTTERMHRLRESHQRVGERPSD